MSPPVYTQTWKKTAEAPVLCVKLVLCFCSANRWQVILKHLKQQQQQRRRRRRRPLTLKPPTFVWSFTPAPLKMFVQQLLWTADKQQDRKKFRSSRWEDFTCLSLDVSGIVSRKVQTLSGLKRSSKCKILCSSDIELVHCCAFCFILERQNF